MISGQFRTSGREDLANLTDDQPKSICLTLNLPRSNSKAEMVSSLYHFLTDNNDGQNDEEDEDEEEKDEQEAVSTATLTKAKHDRPDGTSDKASKKARIEPLTVTGGVATSILVPVSPADGLQEPFSSTAVAATTTTTTGSTANVSPSLGDRVPITLLWDVNRVQDNELQSKLEGKHFGCPRNSKFLMIVKKLLTREQEQHLQIQFGSALRE